MFRRVAQALAIVSALTGCVAAPPNGPFVEFGPDLTPITRPSPCAATYVLVEKGPNASPVPLMEYGAHKGERVGFRRADDGSVLAVTPDRTFPLPPCAGAYAWQVVPGSYPPWRERFRDAAGACAGRAIQTTGNALLTASLIVVGSALVVMYALAQSNSRGR